MSTLHMLASAYDTICCSYIFENEEGLMVFDGGFECEEPTILAYIEALGKPVHTWFFTHPHDDHIGACVQILRNYPERIRLGQLCFNFLPTDTLYSIGGENESIVLVRELYKLIDSLAIPVLTPEVGTEIVMGGARVVCQRIPNPELEGNSYNNSSVVLRLESDGKSVIFLGDLGVEGGQDLLSRVPAEELRADYCQMAHHGQNGVERAVYEAILPEVCLWSTPTWLWENKGEGGYDTGPYRTIVVRGWISDMRCCKKHYLPHNGHVRIEF